MWGLSCEVCIKNGGELEDGMGEKQDTGKRKTVRRNSPGCLNFPFRKLFGSDQEIAIPNTIPAMMIAPMAIGSTYFTMKAYAGASVNLFLPSPVASLMEF